jgi:hypothetical protein
MLCAHSQHDTGNASFSEKDQNNPGRLSLEHLIGSDQGRQRTRIF